jgi:Fungal specific transcription factor domain
MLILTVICTASSTLAIFDPDKNEFLSLLVRLALSDSAPSSMAVLQAALALSSFHRHGLQGDVFQLKARALRTLITSCTPSIESPTVVQHIAASMILCHLEVCSILGLYSF